MLTRRTFIGVSGSAATGLSRLVAAEMGAGLDERVAAADRLISDQVNSGEIAAAALIVRRKTFEFARGYGSAKVETPFLIASPTKPMTVSAAMWLRERRQLALTDRVAKFLPQYKGGDRDKTTIHHLLTHTSGLPDMLPENVELRQRHAPLAEFTDRTCRTKLLFRPGAQVGYQSMGILLAAAIVEEIVAQPLPAFLAANIFKPLRMADTSLGLGGRKIADTAQCQVPERSDWDWNSPYWRNLGAPWGGAHSTVRDLAAFLEAFVARGAGPWKPATRREMIEIQTGSMHPSYGLGWMREPGVFGATCSTGAFGHHGSTGTVAWHEPASHTTCVILTTKPATESRARVLTPVSELVGHS